MRPQEREGRCRQSQRANEIAVEAFLREKIGFSDIVFVVEQVLSRHSVQEEPSIDEILAADRWAKEEAGQTIKGMRN